MVEALAGQLSYLMALNKKPIIVQLNSYGGCVTDSVAMLDLVHASRAPVFIVATGAAYSAAALVLALGPEGSRAATPHTSMMFHGVKVGSDSELLKNVEGYTKFLKAEEKRLNKEICKRTKFGLANFQKVMDGGGEIWLTAREALKKGVIDEIWTPELSEEVYRQIRGK
jgi:ATP-dependent Clp protease protease subunit